MEALTRGVEAEDRPARRTLPRWIGLSAHDEKVRDMKEHLWSDLRNLRDAFLWKLEGLGEYDLRRPMTPTGTTCSE